MTALTWNEALALQQPHMDDTHREFVELLSALEARLPAADTEPAPGELQALQAACTALVAHTVEHFAQEDRWMAALGFAAGNCHGFQHAQVLEVMREVERRLLQQGDVATVRALVPGLAQWFTHHAPQMDAALAQLMAERGFDPATGAISPQPEPAAPITGCGSTRCG